MPQTDNGIIKLVLASGSPRRKEILENNGYSFLQVVPQCDESILPNENPTDYVKRLAILKASEGAKLVKPLSGPALVLGADTTVVFEGILLGKPVDEDEAFSHLTCLSNHTHEVLTGYALVTKTGTLVHAGVGVSRVTFADIGVEEMKGYIKTGDPMDKAGAYAAQGEFARFITRIEGLLSNVIGLPIEEIKPWLEKAGIVK